jgi:hypothetical protein
MVRRNDEEGSLSAGCSCSGPLYQAMDLVKDVIIAVRAIHVVSDCAA